MKAIKYWMLIVLLGLSQIACNTVEGIGEDAESAGDAIEDATEND